MPPTARVLIAQRRLTHYRVPLFERLRSSLADVGVSLDLVHGQPLPEEVEKNDAGVLAWAKTVENRYWRVGGKSLCWQPLGSELRGTDLLVITQENSLLSNYPRLIRRHFGGLRVAFWGHGGNLQSKDPNGLSERFKRWTSTAVDWWFAYTGLSVELVASTGFPRQRITNLENAIDTTAMRSDMASIQPYEITRLRSQLGWEQVRVGIFLGSLHADKRLDFLMRAADKLHELDSDFRLLVVGDGPLREKIRAATAERPWCAWVGARAGREKAAYLTLGDVLLNPGAVGLAILDAFAAGVPMVTTDCGTHGPEIAYLRQNQTGLVTENTEHFYVSGVRQILNDKHYRNSLVIGCRKAAEHYTIENMAKNFCQGILGALEGGG